ncbi:glycosyltransferase family 4 protein [Massilia sp. TSP1-1-2]|uniref:glycosyltransferase family 4 protein n=1 Tax=unclassified Massilia TaxID=2609279 RepID=UPI003CF2D2BC
MRIGILSYPMLFQRDAALQVQVRETTRALNALQQVDGNALTVELVGADPTHLDSYDLIHVFSASGGNHRIVEAAAELGVPVVLSPLISAGWDRSCGEHARLADHKMGKQTAWSVQSTYAQTRRSLQLASAVVALGENEKKAIEEGFLIDSAKIRVFPNGVSAHLFDADGDLFRLRTGIAGPFVLMAGAISPYQNQLGMAQVLAELALPFVLLGEARERDQDYLRQLRAVRGVTCLGGLKHDPNMLASAYAAASVLVLPCQGDGCARTVFDTLAAGTPVVMSSSSVLDLPEGGFALRQVAWSDAAAQKQALLELIAAPPARSSVRDLVRPYTWERAAGQLAACYAGLVDSKAVAL